VYPYEANKAKLLDVTGRKLTSGLFEELADPTSGYTPLFKLSDWRKVYVHIADPTDYEAAKTLIGSWEHWEALAANPRFKEHLESWRKEVAVKLRSQAIAHLRSQAATDKGTAAARWLAEQGLDARKTTRKREDKDPDQSRVNDDAKRLGLLKVVGGNKG